MPSAIGASSYNSEKCDTAFGMAFGCNHAETASNSKYWNSKKKNRVIFRSCDFVRAVEGRKKESVSAQTIKLSAF